MLSGAGIVKGTGAANDTAGKKVYVHSTFDLVIEGQNAVRNTDGTITPAKLYARLPHDIRDGAILVVTKEAPIYATTLDEAGAPKFFLSAISQNEIFTDEALATQVSVGDRGILNLTGTQDIFFKINIPGINYPDNTATPIASMPVKAGDTVRIDCYTVHGEGAQELEISADEFAGYYYIEADTLFREEATGQDLPAQFVIPRGKIQSNFTFTMANSGKKFGLPEYKHSLNCWKLLAA